MEYQESVKRRCRDETCHSDKLNEKAKRKFIRTRHIDSPQYTVIIGWKNWCAFEPEEDENDVEPLVRKRKWHMLELESHIESAPKTVVILKPESVVKEGISQHKPKFNEDREEDISQQKSRFLEEVKEEEIVQCENMTLNSHIMDVKISSIDVFTSSMDHDCKDPSNSDKVSNNSVVDDSSNPSLHGKNNSPHQKMHHKSSEEGVLSDGEGDVARTEGGDDGRRSKRFKAHQGNFYLYNVKFRFFVYG
jgi:hypothetical protein